MPKVTKKGESGARKALRVKRESGASPPATPAPPSDAYDQVSSVRGVWLEQLFQAVLDLPIDDGQRAVVTAMVDALAGILPDHAVGACFVPEPGTATHGQVVVTRLAAGAVASAAGIDPTRVFPGLAHELVLAVPGSTTGSTLHVASDLDALAAGESVAARLVERAASALGRALQGSRQLTAPAFAPAP